MSEYTKSYTAVHKEQRKAYNTDYKLKNKESLAEYNKIYLASYYDENKTQIIKGQNEYCKERRKRDPVFKLKVNLRRRLAHAMKGVQRPATTVKLVGCPLKELKIKLEALFRPGMTWDNYGAVWHVDHIKPISAFNLLDSIEIMEVNHYSNLQPLFASENYKKSNKY